MKENVHHTRCPSCGHLWSFKGEASEIARQHCDKCGWHEHDWHLIWTSPDDRSGCLECRKCGARQYDPELPAVVPIPKGYFTSVKKETDK